MYQTFCLTLLLHASFAFTFRCKLRLYKQCAGDLPLIWLDTHGQLRGQWQSRWSVKVRPHYATWHTAGKCDKATRQKLRHATSICGCCVGLAVACRSMLHGLKIRSANCQSHQKKPRGIWWVRGFKMVLASLRKKSDHVRWSRSTVLVTWRRSAKHSFFMWTRSHWRHMPSNFCRMAKLQGIEFCRAA